MAVGDVARGAWIIGVGLAMAIAGIILILSGMMTGGPLLLGFAAVNVVTGAVLLRQDQRVAASRVDVESQR